MQERPTQLVAGEVLRWTISLVNPNDPTSAIDADSNPSIAIRKNGTATFDSVTVVKRVGTTGDYDCEYDPAGEVFSDQFQVEETVIIGGITYPPKKWPFLVVKEPAVAGDQMDLVNILNATAVSAIQSGVSTLTDAQVWAYAGGRTLTAFAFNPVPSNASDTSAILAIAEALPDSGALTSIISAIAAVNSIASAVKAVTDKVDTGLEADGEVWRATEAFLALAPGGGAGGSATLDNQTEILAAISTLSETLTVAGVSIPDGLTGEPATDLITVRGQVYARLMSMLAQPKPSYSIDGQTFQWAAYQRMLLDAIGTIDTLLAQNNPVEAQTKAVV